MARVTGNVMFQSWKIVEDFQALIEQLDPVENKADYNLDWWEVVKLKFKDLIKTHSSRIACARGSNLTTVKSKLDQLKKNTNYSSVSKPRLNGPLRGRA
jgi:hypothetical protein